MAYVTTTIEIGAAEITLDIAGSVEMYNFRGEVACSPLYADVFIDDIIWTHTGQPVSRNFRNFFTKENYHDFEEALREAYM